MNNTPEQAREIVAKALESGEYTQGFGHLEMRVSDTECVNCVLGVATREYMKHEDASLSVNIYAEKGLYPKQVFLDDQSLCLPRAVMDWLGLKTQEGHYDGGRLAGDNDGGLTIKLDKRGLRARGGGKPFTWLAGMFRNPPEGLLE